MRVIRTTVTIKCRLPYENWPKVCVCVQSMIRISFESASMKPFQLGLWAALFPEKSGSIDNVQNFQKQIANSENFRTEAKETKKNVFKRCQRVYLQRYLAKFWIFWRVGFWGCFVFLASILCAVQDACARPRIVGGRQLLLLQTYTSCVVEPRRC